MTSRERFLKVFRGELPDRVPVTLFLADQGHFLNQMYPDVDPWDFDTLQLKVLEVQKQLGVDVFVRLLYGIWDPLNPIYGGLDVSRSTDSWEVRMQKVRNEDTLIERATIRTPGGTLTQDFSINEIRPGTFMFACTKHPIQSPQDLELARKYEPKMPPDWPKKARERVQRVKKAVGQDGIVGTWSPHGPYNNCSLLIEANTLYCLFLVDPGYYRDLITFAYERSLPYAKALDEAGVDVHCVGGNVPGGFLGKPNYDTSLISHRRSSADCLISYDGNYYSVPAAYHRRVLLVRETEQDELIICTSQGDEIARHRLSTDYNQRIIEPAHYQGVASRTALRQPAPATQLVLTTFETAHQGAAPVVETRALSLYELLAEEALA